MQFSDAIATGRVLMDVWDSDTYCGCAIAAGIKGAGVEPCRIDADFASSQWLNSALKVWPWLRNMVDVPDWVVRRYSTYLSRPKQIAAYNVVSDMFGMFVHKEMTLESLIDWVRSVEPEENSVDMVPVEEVEYASMT